MVPPYANRIEVDMLRLESSIERSVVQRAASRLGVMLLKVTPDSSTGWPDRLAVLPGGRVIWLEFKRPGEKPTPKQTYVHGALRKIGHQVEIITDANVGLGIIEKALQP